jgi:hypothetical protein
MFAMWGLDQVPARVTVLAILAAVFYLGTLLISL